MKNSLIVEKKCNPACGASSSNGLNGLLAVGRASRVNGIMLSRRG